MNGPLVDTEAAAAEYGAHVDRWLQGKEALIPPHEFIASKFAEALVEKIMAEQGILFA